MSASTPKNITSFEVLNSIVSNNVDQKFDLDSPFSFLEFLTYARVLGNTPLTFAQYNIYIKNWNDITLKQRNANAVDIKTQFLNLLTDIKLKFTTNEERKFLSNIDVNSPENLEIVIPFFARKIKDICVFYSKKRNTYKRTIELLPSKGNNKSVQENIRDVIVSSIETEDDSLSINLGKPLSAALVDLNIEIENKYDVNNTYYDLDPVQSPTFYGETGLRAEYFSSNTNEIQPDFYFSEETAIRHIISEKNIGLDEILGLTINVNAADLSYLSQSDTIDYTQPTFANLQYITAKELAKNYVGTDFYYISTNTFNDVVTGELFKASHPYRNLINIYNPTSITVPSVNLKTEREIGAFFKPTFQGIIRMESGFTFSINYDNLKKDSVYVFPDPSKYGNISNTTGLNAKTPIIFKLDDSSSFRNISTSVGSNLPKILNHIQDFTAYSTIESKSFKSDYTGNFNSISQFIEKGDIYTKETDIFGNIYICFSNDSYFTQNASGNFIGGTPTGNNFPNTRTVFRNNTTKNKETLSFKQFDFKSYFFIDINTQTPTPLSGAFIEVFNKYKGDIELYTDIENIIEFAVFNNVFYMKTSRFVVIDTFSYSNNITPTSDIPVILKYNNLPSVGTNISFISTPYRVENDLYYSIVETRNSVNSKYLVVSVYRYNLPQSKNFTIFDKNTITLSAYQSLFTFQDIDTNITQIRQSKLVFNSRGNVFLLTTNFVDLNFTPILHTLVFRVKNNQPDIINNKYYKPTNEVVTSNCYTVSALSIDFFTQRILSTPTQTIYDGTISL